MKHVVLGIIIVIAWFVLDIALDFVKYKFFRAIDSKPRRRRK